jgi:hypothetical protein
MLAQPRTEGSALKTAASENPFFSPHLKLPTDAVLGEAVPRDADPVAVASEWIDRLSAAVSGQGATAFADLFIEDGWWRDRLTFTWSYRSLYGRSKIQSVFAATSQRTAAQCFKLDLAVPPAVLSPYPDLTFVQAHFTFDAALTNNEGIVNLVKYKGVWLAWTLLTMVDDVKTHPEQRQRQDRKPISNAFDEDASPPIVIIGAGQR